MTMRFPKVLLLILSGVVLSSQVPSALAQPYPNKPVIIYCGYPAGASTDLTTRGLTDGAEKILGVPFVVETKTGGGATVAAALVASKMPDG